MYYFSLMDDPEYRQCTKQIIEGIESNGEILAQNGDVVSEELDW